MLKPIIMMLTVGLTVFQSISKYKCWLHTYRAELYCTSPWFIRNW